MNARTDTVSPLDLPASARPLFVCELVELGGAERSLLALFRWLHRHDMPSYMLTYTDHCNFAQYADFPLHIVTLNPGQGVRAKVSALRSFFSARPAGSAEPLCSGYQPALHATLAGLRGFHDLMLDTPSLFYDPAAHTLPGRLRIAVSNKIIGFGLRSGGATIVNSEYLQAESRRDFGIESHIIRMGGMSPVTEAPPTRTLIPGGPLSMLSVCRIEANKRIDWILRALAILERGPVAPLTAPLSATVDWHLELVGKGSKLEELKHLAAQLGLSERVHFHGFVSDQQLDELYAHADLFLMPALQGYGIPAIEAIERGIPVLLHRESGISDVLLDTPWAVVLNAGEEGLPAAMALAVDNLLHGRHHGAPPPRLPSEDEWSQRVAELCHWV